LCSIFRAIQMSTNCIGCFSDVVRPLSWGELLSRALVIFARMRASISVVYIYNSRTIERLAQSLRPGNDSGHV
jgi:hypothetical protein